MIEDHVKINSALLDAERFLKEDKFLEAIEQLDHFRWMLEKHLFAEEKAVFGMFQKMKQDKVSQIFDLMQEHGELLGLLNKVEEQIANKEQPDILMLKTSLINHAKFEDETFYPLMEEDLTSEQQQEIIKRIKDVILF